SQRYLQMGEAQHLVRQRVDAWNAGVVRPPQAHKLAIKCRWQVFGDLAHGALDPTVVVEKPFRRLHQLGRWLGADRPRLLQPSPDQLQMLPNRQRRRFATLDSEPFT